MLKFVLLAIVLFLSACAQPTTRLPSINQYDQVEMRRIRRELNHGAYESTRQLSKRVNSLYYTLTKSTGEELCARKLVPDTGLVYMKVGRFGTTKLFNPYADIEKEMEDDNKEIFGRKVDEIVIQQVLKGSAAEKAGVKDGDILISLYGVPAPSGEEAFKRLAEIIKSNVNSGLPIDVEVERGGKNLSFTMEPDMVCPYPLIIDDTMHALNAFSDGNYVYVTLEMIDFMQDDNLLAAVMAHELAHNNFGHRNSKETNEAIGTIAGAFSEVMFGTPGSASNTGQMASQLYSKEFEFEADYASVYYMARAGFDYHKMPQLQKRLSERNVMSLYLKGTSHPKPQDRFVLLVETAKEIDLKKSFNEDLLPDFNDKNPFLQNKKD